MCVLEQLHFDVATWSSTHRRGFWRQTRRIRAARRGTVLSCVFSDLAKMFFYAVTQ